MPRYRQLPDGTWLDEKYGRVTAPVTDPRGGGAWKRTPSPPAGPMGVPFRQPDIDIHARGVDGMGMYYPGNAGIHARPGRNYSALGILENMSDTMKYVLLLGTVFAATGLTIYLAKRGAGKK